jgi:hypothetical protein
MPTSDSQYAKQPLKFISAGVDLHAPVDLLPPGKFSRLLNVRGSKEAGTLQARPGLSIVNPTPLDTDVGEGVHSIRRLNDNIGDNDDWVGTYVHVIGCGKRVSIIDSTGAWTVFIPWDASPVTPAAWSGRPLSLLPWRPESSPRTWMYIWDSDRQAKIGRDELDPTLPIGWQMRDIGITPPNDNPNNTAGAGSYQYRYRYRDSTTGTVSNPSPETLSMFALGGTLSATASLDPQVTHIDFFRFGGALLEYFYVGSAPNTAPTFVDNITDADAQLNEVLPTDRDQPFTVAGIPIQGTCTVATAGGLATVTWVSGDLFVNTKNGSLPMAPGTLVNLSGVSYAMYRATNSATQIVVRDPLGTAGTATTFVIQNPVMMGKSLPFVWGPFLGVFFACGDVLNPGTLYWTNGNDSDSASALNFQEVTTPSEPLLNGFVMDGRAYVFSSERMFAIFPDPTNVGTAWQIVETPCQRGMWTNWCYTTLGDKQGGGECYFLGRDGIWVTQGGRAENITDADLYELFPHEGDNTQGVASNGYLPVDMTQRTYLRLAHQRGYLYFDYKDSEGAIRTLTYEIASKAWYPDTYTPPLRVHYGDEGREAGQLLAGSDNGVVYFSGGASDNAVTIPCNVRTRSEDFGDPAVQKLVGDVATEISTGDQSITITPYFNNESVVGTGATYLGSAARTHRILDINSGAGQIAYNVAMDFTWSNAGASAVLFIWTPSAVPKPADIQQRCIEWHEFLPGISDAYVTGLRLWVDTRDQNGVVQTKTVGVWADQLAVQTISVTGNGETDLIFTWPVFKGKLGRLLPTDTNRCRILNWEWVAENEPPLTANWDSNWMPLGERTSIAYVTGIVVVADTQGAPKTFVFQSEFEGVYSGHTAIGGSNAMSTVIRGTHSFAFTPFRAEQLRFYSYDGMMGRLYTWEWVTHFVEPRFLDNWDATYQWFETERLIKGIRIDADTIGMAKSIDVDLDGAVYTTLSVTHNGRLAKFYDMPLDPATNEYPRGRVARLYPTDANPAFLYSVKWIAEEEPPKLANWNAKWEDSGAFGARWLQGFVLDADTAGAVKTVIVEYYPEGAGSALTNAGEFEVQCTGRGGKAYSLKPPVIAHKWRLRPTDANQRWLYGVKWVDEPHPELVHHWETQGYAQGLPGYQHRRRGYVALVSTGTVYWVQEIDGAAYAIGLPNTAGAYRKIHAPCLPIKGKIFKDTLRCDLPSGVPLIYTLTLEGTGTTPNEDIVVGSADDTSSFLNADDPSVEVT